MPIGRRCCDRLGERTDVIKACFNFTQQRIDLIFLDIKQVANALIESRNTIVATGTVSQRTAENIRQVNDGCNLERKRRLGRVCDGVR